MKSSEKIAAPVLVVGLLCATIIGDPHHLKDAKKTMSFSNWNFPVHVTHKSLLDATRKGFIEELKKEGYVDGKIFDDFKCSRSTKSGKIFLNN